MNYEINDELLRQSGFFAEDCNRKWNTSSAQVSYKWPHGGKFPAIWVELTGDHMWRVGVAYSDTDFHCMRNQFPGPTILWLSNAVKVFTGHSLPSTKEMRLGNVPDMPLRVALEQWGVNTPMLKATLARSINEYQDKVEKVKTEDRNPAEDLYVENVRLLLEALSGRMPVFEDGME